MIFVIVVLLTFLWNMELKICVYFLMDFYLIEKSYPETREIANFGKILPIIPPMKKPDLQPCLQKIAFMNSVKDFMPLSKGKS